MLFTHSIVAVIFFCVVFKDIQQKVRTYVLSTDLAYFKYDDFIFVLDIINR